MHTDGGSVQEVSLVMLSAAKHLDAQRDRPFAVVQGDKKGPSISINRRKSPSKSGFLPLFMASFDAYWVIM
jgi:hypothetical protein